jgi:hypothetical protein
MKHFGPERSRSRQLAGVVVDACSWAERDDDCQMNDV